MSAAFWRLAAIVMCLATPAVARQATESIPAPVPVVVEEPAPGSMGLPPRLIGPPVIDDDKYSWCRGPEGIIARCKSGGQVVIDDGSFPSRAEEDEVEGLAIIWCTVKDPAGHVACKPVAESVTGYGFGEAAVKAVSRSSLLVSPEGYDLTGFSHSVSVPFLFGGRLGYSWRDFASADGLAALMPAEDRARMPPLDPNGFEVPNANVELQCRQDDDAHHVHCEIITENDPDLHLGAPAAALMNAEARLVAPNGPVRTTLLFPLGRPQLVTPITQADIITAASRATGKLPKGSEAPYSVSVTLRCRVVDAAGHLDCETAWQGYVPYHFGEELARLYTERGQVTVDEGWPLEGRVLRYDLWLRMADIGDCRRRLAAGEETCGTSDDAY